MERRIIAAQGEQARPFADSLQLALSAARTAAENRGRDVAVLDMRKLTPLFDYFVIATGNSRRQLHAISEEIDHVLEDELGDKRLSIEGYQESRWIVLDYGAVVVHLFDQPMREYYALEQLWARATPVELPFTSERAVDDPEYVPSETIAPHNAMPHDENGVVAPHAGNGDDQSHDMNGNAPGIAIVDDSPFPTDEPSDEAGA